MEVYQCPNCKAEVEHDSAIVCGTCSDFPDVEDGVTVYMEIVK